MLKNPLVIYILSFRGGLAVYQLGWPNASPVPKTYLWADVYRALPLAHPFQNMIAFSVLLVPLVWTLFLARQLERLSGRGSRTRTFSQLQEARL
jgi:hypothetical protein